MRPRAHYVMAVITGLSLSACRQADGLIPVPDQTIQEELVDVTRDLQNITASRDPQAPFDLADDLRKYAPRSDAEFAIDQLSQDTAAALPGTELTEQIAQQLAYNLWLSVAAFELSERQVETLQNDVQSLLMSVGVADEIAQQVAAQVGDVQNAVTNRSRRWYELF